MNTYTWLPALVFGLGSLFTSFIPLGSDRESRDSGALTFGAVFSGIVTGAVVFFFNLGVLYYHMPPTIAPSLWFWVFCDLIIALVVNLICDLFAESFTLASMLVIVSMVAWVAFGTFQVNNDINHTDEARKFLAANVKVVPTKDLPDTSTDHMISVPNEVAQAKADTDLGQGYAGRTSFNTYYNPLPVVPQMFQNHFYGLVAYTYDGANLKHQKGSRIPGYQLVDLENKRADVTQNFDKDPKTGADYWYKYTIDGGQDEDVVRHAYQNGYSDYGLEDPTPEIDESGHLFFTITLTKPGAGWGYEVPVGMITVDAASGHIEPYMFSGPNARPIPSWVDRVYSADMVTMLLNYWGNWQGADFCAMNCNGGGRFKVDNTPILAYDKDGDPTWRVLMTSQNDNPSANWVMLVDARTGAIKQFTPLSSMPIEERIKGFFESAMGTNGVKIPFAPVDLTFHVITGEPTWMMTYLSADGKSVAGYGFMQAYNNSPGDVAFGTTKDEALDAYSTKLAAPTSSGAPQQGGKISNISGVITGIQKWDEGGQTFAYIKVDNKPGFKFKVPLNGKNSDVGFALAGYTAVITYNDSGPDKTVVDVSSIAVSPPSSKSSVTQALFVERQPLAMLEVGGALLLMMVLAGYFGWWRPRKRRSTGSTVDSPEGVLTDADDLTEAREHLEELTGQDVNGDGFIGDPEADAEPADRITHV